MRPQREVEHLRAFKFLKRAILTQEYRPPIFGTVRNCVKTPMSFVIRSGGDIRFIIDPESRRCVGIEVPRERGEPIRLNVDCSYSVHVGKDAAGKAIFLTDLNN